jgi:hypothetical protein
MLIGNMADCRTFFKSQEPIVGAANRHSSPGNESFQVKFVLRRLAMGDPRKFNGSHTRNPRFTVVYG